MSENTVGFIGLGNMGGPMATHLVSAGSKLLVHDAAGTQTRAPSGASVAANNQAVARGAELIILSLPNAEIVEIVTNELMNTKDRRVHTIIDTSTIGTTAAREMYAALAKTDILYLDCPVSGGVSGARNATITAMFAGPATDYERYAPLLRNVAANVIHVGVAAGLGQAMKLLNNFLSATALAATSEAIAFGVGQGLEMATMLDALNTSSGRNTATADKFPNRILTDSYDAGFTSRLMEKDVRLYLEAVNEAHGEQPVAPAVHKVWQQLEDAEPNTDICRIYPFVRDGHFDDDA